MNNTFDLNDYMLDGLIEDALRGDLHAKSTLVSECRVYQRKRKKPPTKIVDCLRMLRKRITGRSRRDSFLEYLTFSYIRHLRNEGYTWDVITKKYEDRFKAASRKSLETIYYIYLKKYQEYQYSFND